MEETIENVVKVMPNFNRFLYNFKFARTSPEQRADKIGRRLYHLSSIIFHLAERPGFHLAKRPGFVKIFHNFLNPQNCLTANFKEKSSRSLPSIFKISPRNLRSDHSLFANY
jgi:hypothetical protein